MLSTKVKWNLLFSFSRELTCTCNVGRYSCKPRRAIYHLSHKNYLQSFRTFSAVAEKDKSSNIVGRDALFKDINYEEIVGEDEALLKKLKVLLLEIDMMRQDGFAVPSKISVDRWKELVNAPSRSQRIKLLSFLHNIERKKEKDAKKKHERKKEFEIKREGLMKEREENKHINYGFGGSTIFLRIYDTKIDAQLNNKLIKAAQFGQDLILDCSYDEHMTPKEASLAAKQLMILFSENRKHKDPFNLHFCNALKDMIVMQKLHKIIPTLYNDDFPLNISEKSYLHLFPKEKLVYLTPHCREDLNTFNHDDIYIIGCMVDKVSNEQLSLGKAKRDGLRMAKLPLDKHLLWHLGSKSLTLNQVLMIMLEMKESGDWNKAFQHVPRRKLLTDKETYNKPSKGPSLYRNRLRQLHRL